MKQPCALGIFSHPSFVNGFYSIDASSLFRRQLLSARLKAANDLYDHSVKCPNSKCPKFFCLRMNEAARLLNTEWALEHP
jgi:hypothetical protein